MKSNQATCTYDDSCFLLVNTGQEIIDSRNGLLTTLAYQLGPKQKPFYALEGAIAYAGSGVDWLKENLSLNIDVIQSNGAIANGNGTVQTFLGESAVLSSYSSGSNIGNAITSLDANANNNVVFVPAFSGLYSPFWKHNASG